MVRWVCAACRAIRGGGLLRPAPVSSYRSESWRSLSPSSAVRPVQLGGVGSSLLGAQWPVRSSSVSGAPPPKWTPLDSLSSRLGEFLSPESPLVQSGTTATTVTRSSPVGAADRIPQQPSPRRTATAWCLSAKMMTASLWEPWNCLPTLMYRDSRPCYSRWVLFSPDYIWIFVNPPAWASQLWTVIHVISYYDSVYSQTLQYMM